MFLREWATLNRMIWLLLHRQEVFIMFIGNQVLALCQDARFEVSGPFCQKSASNLLSKHHGEVLLNLWKKHFKSLQPRQDIKHPSMNFQSFYSFATKTVYLEWHFKNKLQVLLLSNKSFLLLPSVECLSFTVKNDVWAEFDNRNLFSPSSARSGKFLCTD